MSLRYKIIFSVDILHEYYTSRFCEDFELVPSTATAALLKGHGMVYKSVGHKLIVLTRTDALGKSFISPDVSAKLYFYLKLKNPHFNNITNLNYRPSETPRYSFSNDNQTKIGTDRYLSSKIPTYNNANEYPIGSFASNVGNEVFEAIKPSNSGNAHGLADTSYWIKRGKFQYANGNDLLEVTSFVYLFNAVADTNFIIRVFGFNPASGMYNSTVMDQVDLTFSSPETTVPVRLETLPAGKYRIEVNGQSKLIYLDSSVLFRDIFGLLELSNHLPPANAFSLFDASGKPKGLLFTIRFANRSVIWKYMSRTNDVTSVEDTAANIIFAPEPGNQFISDKPIPLQEKPVTTILLKSTSLGDISPLANPGKDRLGTITKAGNTYLCSELHLNY